MIGPSALPVPRSAVGRSTSRRAASAPGPRWRPGQRLGTAPHRVSPRRDLSPVAALLPAAASDGRDSQPVHLTRLLQAAVQSGGQRPAPRTRRRRPGRSAGRSAAPRRVPAAARALRPRPGSPRAKRWAATASASNREATSRRGSAANWPEYGFPCATTIRQLLRPRPERLGSAANCLIDNPDRKAAS